MAYQGVFMGRVLIQKGAQIGGKRYVFVPLQGVKNDLTFPPYGGKVMNPFKGQGKMFAGDLVEYRPNMENELGSEVYLLKTFKVAKASAADAVDVLIERDGYKHIPCVGDILMKAPAALTGTGAADTVVAVESTVDAGKNVWKLTFAATIGVLAVGDVMIEAAEKGAGKKALVQNPNAVLHVDYDFFFQPSTAPEDVEGAKYFLTPAMHGTMYTERMSPLPAAVLALNASKVKGWFTI